MKNIYASKKLKKSLEIDWDTPNPNKMAQHRRP
jgi:hypothetical protein